MTKRKNQLFITCYKILYFLSIIYSSILLAFLFSLYIMMNKSNSGHILLPLSFICKYQYIESWHWRNNPSQVKVCRFYFRHDISTKLFVCLRTTLFLDLTLLGLPSIFRSFYDYYSLTHTHFPIQVNQNRISIKHIVVCEARNIQKYKIREERINKSENIFIY